MYESVISEKKNLPTNLFYKFLKNYLSLWDRSQVPRHNGSTRFNLFTFHVSFQYDPLAYKKKL